MSARPSWFKRFHLIGNCSKFGAAGLVMAILGGVPMPLVHGALMEASGASYITPALCFLVVAGYGVFDLASKSPFADAPQAA